MNCKVIPTYCGWRKAFGGTEDIDFFISNLENKTFLYELSVDKGVPCDTIIVNNSPENEYFSEFINSYHNTKTPNGLMKIIDGDNIGISFGGYNFAFKNFKEDYQDYWMFQEDDFVYIRDGYYKDAVCVLEQDLNVGYVCMFGPVGPQPAGWLSPNDPGDTSQKYPAHCNGGFGISRYSDLIKIYNHFGSLPHYKSIGMKDRRERGKHILQGEIPFTNVFTTFLNKTLVSIDNSGHPDGYPDDETRMYIKW